MPHASAHQRSKSLPFLTEYAGSEAAELKACDLAVYDTTYLMLAMPHRPTIATVDGKLRMAGEQASLEVIAP